MKKMFKVRAVLLLFLMLTTWTVNAQIEFNPSTDIYSNYIWRGSNIGTGPSIQPDLSMTADSSLTIGVWGAFDFSGYSEADLYVVYEFPFGLSLGATDYYYPGTSYFDYSEVSGNHAFEANLSYEIKGFSISGNYIFNKAGGALSSGADKYFELGYDFKKIKVFVGAGDGWHTSDSDFAVCNIGLETSKEIKITESFTVPVTGAVILNPEKEYFNVVVGFTF